MEQFQDLSVNIGHGNPFPPWRQGYVFAQFKYITDCYDKKAAFSLAKLNHIQTIRYGSHTRARARDAPILLSIPIPILRLF